MTLLYVKPRLLATAQSRPQNQVMLDADKKGLRRRLREAMDEEGVSNKALADTAGVSLQAVGDWLRTGRIGRDRLPSIAATVNRTIEWLLSGKESSPSPIQEQLTDHHVTPGAEPVYREIPVVGTTEVGPDSQWFDLGYPSDFGEAYLDTPTKDRSAYALGVVGSSMDPRFREGDVLAISPAVEPVPGDDVVVKQVNGSLMVKELVAIREDTVALRSIGRGERRLVIGRDDVDFIHVVTGIHPSSTVKSR